MSLSPLPIAILVPPINLLLPCLGGLLVIRRRPRLGTAMLAIGVGGLFALSLPAVSKRLIASLETELPMQPSATHPPQAIVILSGDAIRTEGGLEAGTLTLDRERAGAALQRRTRLPVLVTGGTLEGSTQTLGGMMAASLAQDFQVPVRWTEAQAQDTRQNAILSATMLHADGIDSIYLVTHAWHMKRSLLAFAKTGLAVTAAPVRLDAVPRTGFAEFIPRTSAWLESYYALHEWIGILAG